MGRRHRLHRPQRPQLPALRGAARRARRRTPADRHELLGQRRGRGLRVLLGRRPRPARPAVEPRATALPARWWPTTCASTVRRARCSPTPTTDRSLRRLPRRRGLLAVVRRPPARAPGRRGVVGRPRADVVASRRASSSSSSPTTGCSSLTGRPQWRRSPAARRRYVEALDRPLRRPHPRPARRWWPSPATRRTSTSCAGGGGRRGVRRGRDRRPRRPGAGAARPIRATAEAEVLGAFPYQPNEAVLHTDRALLPRRRAAWAAWNYHLPPSRAAAAP